MPHFIKCTPKDIQSCRVKKSWAMCLFLVSVITIVATYQIYSRSGALVFDIQPTSNVNSSLATRGPPSIHVRSQNVSKNLESPGRRKNTSLLQQSTDVNKTVPTFHHPSSDSCPTIHIVMIIVSYNESRSSFLTIKSILMYRQTKLHFHFITDSTAQMILGPMMSSWLLPGVEFDFYSITEAWSTTPWSNSQQCSKEMLKIAALHLVLPHEIDAVVVVDPNLIITASVSQMFYQTLMDLEQKGRLIALSNSECSIECSNGSVIQRNISHSTSGVMVLNLAGMRSSASWRNLWEAIRNESPDYKQIPSLDTMREVYTTLRCDWNTYGHLPSSIPDDCWPNMSVFEQELKSNTLLQPIQDYDGYQLRFKAKGNCYHGDPKLKKPPSPGTNKEKCVVLQWEGTAKRRMYPYFLGYKFTTSDPHDVTLVNHLTLERMHLVEVASKHWDGPMSLAIHVTDSQVQGVIDFVSKSDLLSQRKNIAYHLLFEISPSYPINPLRILGHKFVTTPYVFFNDVDFIPSYGLYDNLKDIIMNNVESMNKTALVVPAFETDSPDIIYPNNRQEMVDMIQRNLVWQFHKYWSPGHAPTDYSKWARNTTTAPYTVTWKQSYEPYIAVKTSVIPFDPRFVSRHHNKISHNEELHMAGYHFIVVHNGFLIHVPHPVSDRSILYPSNCYANRYKNWKKEKQKQYGKH